MSSTNTDPQGDLKTALNHAASLLQHSPALAEQQAREILKVIPDLDPANHILGAALRVQGKLPDALEIIKPLKDKLPFSAPIWLEYGLVLAAAGKTADAIKALRQTVSLDPEHAESWRVLAEQLSLAGDGPAAVKATDKYISLLSRNRELATISDLFRQGKIPEAEKRARDFLKQQPANVVAMRLLAEIGAKLGQFEDARALLERSLELAPQYHHARTSYVMALYRSQKLREALEQTEILLKDDPDNTRFMSLKAMVLVQKGDHDEALKIYEEIAEKRPDQPQSYLYYGHTLKTVGRLDDSVSAYRKSIELSDKAGEIYWSLANLKTFKFSDEDIEDMISRVTSEGGDPEDQAHLAFALGKAFEDRKDYENAFKYYKRGNGIRRLGHPYDAKINIYDTVRQIKCFDREYFAARQGWGSPAPDPIFIVGLPRAGSTLLEQILASHSQVEGTTELVDIIALSRKLGGKKRIKSASDYPEIMREHDEETFREMGESYLETSSIQRNTEAPCFIDKMPNNFQHIGLIHSILPNAKIIDARRHPMGGCFAGFKQLFARGQTFTYDLQDIGYYYRDYVKLMDHWDEVLPGRIHRVQYEEMVADTENQIRALLDYCGLEFEDSCLKFYETDRAVRTPSAEQVRQPIYKGGLEQWRNFEPWLDPLKDALGPVLDRYPID
ncbi:tetratricopeptide repeat-containing sulfotransferase family protein [Emcibacter nanhaiensis]|uniref:Tetratricopeptide repeat protein n=1 Tax=Emcibacter nanhaiensis TaxID=1505037 RepID=A0A501PJR6_9PROT|nr:tetratricopeptide repeat-containing sulfotransferase family protein [Emcibacter nanhaiensis]TPD60763.1 tetratricopeptide repeat protein [Emcibacter nanhaiensis]